MDALPLRLLAPVSRWTRLVAAKGRGHRHEWRRQRQARIGKRRFLPLFARLISGSEVASSLGPEPSKNKPEKQASL